MRPLLAILLLLLGGCGQTPAPAPAAPARHGEPAEPKTVAATRERVMPAVEALLGHLKGPISLGWSAEGDSVLLKLAAFQEEKIVRWRVENDGTTTPDSDLARRLEEGATTWSRQELASLVPLAWLPVLEVSVVSRPSYHQPEPEPAEPTPSVSAPPEVVLVGVMTGDVRKAFLQIEGHRYSLRVGEQAEGYRVDAITRRQVVLSGHGRRVEKSLDTSAAPAYEFALPKPEPESQPEPAPETGVTILNNDDLDYSPPIQLEGGWRKFETGE